MALNMFISFDDGAKIKGESQDANHSGESEILAWSWGASQSGSTHYGKGGGAGKANIQDLSFTKYLDGASSAILQHSVFGEHITTVKLTMERVGGIDNKQQKLLEVTLTDVIVSSYSTGGSGGEDRLTENVSLNFAKYKFETFTQDENGVAASSGQSEYSIVAHA